MHVTHFQTKRSPLSHDHVRLEARVSYDDKSLPSEAYWFDVPERYAEYASGSGNPWLACLVPLAVNLNEPLRISRPVDRTLFINVHELMRIWKCWYPEHRPIPIEAETTGRNVVTTPTATASMFSGGVDAWFTLLRHCKSSAGADNIPVDDLLCVWGLDIKLKNPDGFQAMRNVLYRATSQFDVQFVTIATNLRETAWWKRGDWGRVAHGCGLASIALALEGRYRIVLIPSTHRYDDLVPWGSHPLTDPLLSTETTRMVHDGAGFSRVEKTRFLTDSEAAMSSLQVCWETQSFKNCESCVKCYRTMITLMLLGALERCSTFSTRTVDLKKIRRIFSEDESSRAFLREVRALALAQDRTDIARAIDRSFKYSRRLERALRWIRPWQSRRFAWRLANVLEHRLLENSIYR